MVGLYLFILLFVSLSESSFPPPERPYKILILLGVSSPSHKNVFIPLANGLADRGHEVSMLSDRPLMKPSLKFKLYHHGLWDIPEYQPYRLDTMNAFELMGSGWAIFQNMRKIITAFSSLIHDDPVVQSLYSRRHEFDLIIFDGLFSESLYPFAHNRTFIMVTTEGFNPRLSATMGNLVNPAYVPNLMSDYPHPYSFKDKLTNFVMSILVPIFWNYYVTGTQQTEISKRFPELPSLLEIEANVSLNLMNWHFSFGSVTPLLPNQVEVGCMHCREPEELPEELEKFLSGDVPVVYMSLGSVVRSASMPSHYKKIVLDVFSKLPYKFLWKFEDDSIRKLPNNIKMMKWMPQQDILAHPNVKAFISHCGLLGSQEAMYHATPVIGMPLGADQAKNAARMQNLGFGKVVKWNDLTADRFEKTIIEVVNNPMYENNLLPIQRTFKDQMESPVDRAVYWTEYVIRHKGAVHLRSPELDLSWVQLLHLDILFALHLTMFLVYKLLMKCVRSFSKRATKEKLKKT